MDVESSVVELSLEFDELDVDESLVLDGDDDELELDGVDELDDGGDVELADHDLNSVSLRYPSPFASAVRKPRPGNPSAGLAPSVCWRKP